jgi:hypothetical protein
MALLSFQANSNIGSSTVQGLTFFYQLIMVY